jgi:NAD(P)-dependent dehydrogenase (short-subunit alcohol dehydrogenase family)
MTDLIPKDYAPAADLLQDRVILVTGAGAGIGRAAALTFAAHGATVVLLGRTTAKLEEVYDEIEAAGHPLAAICPLNLEGASPKDYQDLAQRLEDEFGKLDGLLHNASILGSLTPIELYDINLWYRVMQINLNAPFMLTQACLPILKKAPEAAVIFTSSSVGRVGRAYWGAYSVAKAGNENLMQILAQELQANTRVRVNSLNPGKVRTRMRAQAYPGEDPNTLVWPQDIMSAYLYLIGPDSHGLSGHALDAQ